MNQNDSEVLWITDFEGNSGKSFLAHYLHVLYNFQLLDGTMSETLGILLTAKLVDFASTLVDLLSTISTTVS